MKKYSFYILIISIFCASCEVKNTKLHIQTPKPSLKDVYTRMGTIQILPLGEVKPLIIKEVSNVVSSFYGRPVEVLQAVKLSPDLLRKKSSRYSADTIIKKFNNERNTIVVTEVDITTWKEEKKLDWGILGLGYQPGRICVVSGSSQRMGRGVSEKKLLSRLRKVSIHELGHNLGLPHCENEITCVMHSAEGKASQIDKEKEAFCNACKNWLLNN